MSSEIATQQDPKDWWASLTQDQRDLHVVKLRNAELVRERDVLRADRDIWRDYCQQLVGMAQVATGVDGRSLYAAPLVVKIKQQLKESEDRYRF
jgi:hypothetical protein